MVLALSRALPAQPHVCSTSVVDSSSSGDATWSPPLDRSITVRATNLSLTRRARSSRDGRANSAFVQLGAGAARPRRVRFGRRGAGRSRARRSADGNATSRRSSLGAIRSFSRRVRGPPMPTGPPMAPTLGVLDRVVVTGTASGAPGEGTVRRTRRRSTDARWRATTRTPSRTRSTRTCPAYGRGRSRRRAC